MATLCFNDLKIGSMMDGGLKPPHTLNVDFETYKYIYKHRHDTIHRLICKKLNLPFGERSLSDIQLINNIKFKTLQYYDDVKTQTPDYMELFEQRADIIEITVSHDPLAERRKKAKYALLTYFLRLNDYTVNYKVIVITPNNIYINRTYLIDECGLDDDVIDKMKDICDNCEDILHSIHRTETGSLHYEKLHELTIDYNQLEFGKDDIYKTYDSIIDKCFESKDHLEKVLDGTSSDLCLNDDLFLDSLCDVDIKNPMESTQQFNSTKFISEQNKPHNTKTKRSFLPMPFIKVDLEDSSIRSTENDLEKCLLMSEKMMQSKDIIINIFGIACNKKMNELIREVNSGKDIKNEDFLFPLNLSQEHRSIIALDGPFRKQFIKKNSLEHIESQHKLSNYWLDYYTDVEEIRKLSYLMSKHDNILETGDIEVDTKFLSGLRGFGLDYVKLCQTIYREVNINAMRGDRRKRHILKPTGANGVFILILKGPKLRAGEQVNNCWFKVIVDGTIMDKNSRFTEGWFFKRMMHDNLISHSRWISADVHRLDHYIRCYDKILMSYCSMLSVRYRSDINLNDDKEENLSLIKQINNDRSNALGMIILIYMENKRSTSKMLQNVRYLVMTSISIYPKYDEVMDKFIGPMRTPLQLYLLKESIRYITSMSIWKTYENAKFGSVRFDHESQTFTDKNGGSNIRLPRILVENEGKPAEFSEILAEMYFTMLFNKNQDDPTHASFQILSKILEGEHDYQEQKDKNMTFGSCQDMNDIEYAMEVLKNRKTHTFSSKAIEIGSKLLRIHHGDVFGIQVKLSSIKRNMNKTMDEYATFKSSSKFERSNYVATEMKQNPRTKCFHQAIDLLKEGCRDSFDVIHKYKDELTFFQVFKKNQIGGVREILILPLTNRIRINVLETISRNICSYDKREILTHGVTKNESFKSCLYSAKKYDGKRLPIHLTFDKSKWGPGFVPIQFMYLFTAFKKQLGTTYYFILDVLMRHQNKLCLYPERLMKAWVQDLGNKIKHDDVLLQQKKEKFLLDKMVYMRNESNMGQGILHYTSSLLHLCMINFRDELYKRLCKKFGLKFDDHEDLLSSDDSYTIFCPEVPVNEVPKFIKFKLSLFLKAQYISEVLYNCRTSSVKSSINPYIGEFNSLFVSNMTFMPTLMKFSMSSVHPLNTDSFFRMVKESYTSSRQIVENGGGLDLYLLSSHLNKVYCESIYHTYEGGVNCLKGIRRENTPYHMGVYPIFNPSLMILFGPEFYNYEMYKNRFNDMNHNEQILFSSSHKLIQGDLSNTLSEFEDGDTILGGLLRIEASIGPIRQLMKLREKAEWGRKELTEFVLKDPLAIIKKPKTIDEIKFRMFQKLYTNGSSEGLKIIAASIYYGRVSASVSAKCFRIPGLEGEARTYSDCLDLLLNESKIINLPDQMKFLYPKHDDYDLFLHNPKRIPSLKTRNPMEIQTVQKISSHKINTKLTQPVSELLEYKWQDKPIPPHLESKVNRDFEIMKLHFPMIRDTITETMDLFSGDLTQKTKGLLMLILKMYSLKDKSFKGILYGPGSNDVVSSYKVLWEHNYTLSHKNESHVDDSVQYRSDTYEEIFLSHNHEILSKLSNSNVVSPWGRISRNHLDHLMMDPSVNKNVKKRLLMIMLDKGIIENVEKWSMKSDMILHTWNVRQRYHKGIWYGSFDITIFLGFDKMNFSYDEAKSTLYISKTNFEDPVIMYTLFKEFKELLSVSDQFLKKVENGPWIIENNKILRIEQGGFKIYDYRGIEDINLRRSSLVIQDDFTTLRDEYGIKIYQIETGLIPSSGKIKDEEDFSFEGIKFSKLSFMGAFSYNFSVLYKDKDESLDYIDDLVCTKPLISKQTKERLNLLDWETRINSTLTSEDKKIDVDAFIDSLVTFEMDDIEVKLEEGEKDMFDVLLDTELVKSLSSSSRIHFPRKMYLIVKNLKYDIICHQLLCEHKINRKNISSIIRIFKDDPNVKYILYSLVSLYDRTYENIGQTSPGVIILSANPQFINKFSLDDGSNENLLNLV